MLAACSSNINGADTAFARFLEADARPSDPSTHVDFGRGSLPPDFPAGLPRPDKASLLGWQRTTSATARSWEAIYELPGDPSVTVNRMIDQLKGPDWQVTDRATQHGFDSLNLNGTGRNDGRTGVVAIGPSSRSGRVLVIEEAGEDR